MHLCIMFSKIEQSFEGKLRKRQWKKTYRTLPKDEGRIDFSSNDYLGFATDGLLENIRPTEQPLSGSKASRLIAGNTLYHENLEKTIATFHRAECGLLFNSGYDANVGLVGCIAQEGDTIIYDELCHASIHDGLKLSRGNPIPFLHNDLADLALKLKEAQGNIFLITEGLFSMDGDFSPLKKIVELCQNWNVGIIIDEAHSTGIVGEQGRGWVSHLGLEEQILARVHTFGKAMGCHGAIVLGSDTLRNYLINYARSFIFTTAMPLHSVQYIKKAYDVLLETNRIEQLNDNILLFTSSLNQRAKHLFLPSSSPIQSLVLADASLTREIAHQLQSEGFDVKPIVAPTVPKEKERIRICIHAFNQKDHIIGLTTTINTILENHPNIHEGK